MLTFAKKWKSGGFPYFVDVDGKVYVCLFISNNIYYGGSKPQMPKGTPKDKERMKPLAIREVNEETGIPLYPLQRSIHYIGKFSFKGQIEDYIQYVFGFKLNKLYKPKNTHEGIGVWYKLDDALEEIRKEQKPFLEILKEKMHV